MIDPRVNYHVFNSFLFDNGSRISEREEPDSKINSETNTRGMRRTEVMVDDAEHG